MQKSGLVWLSRPLDKVLNLWANLDLLLDPNYAALIGQNQHYDIFHGISILRALDYLEIWSYLAS